MKARVPGSCGELVQGVMQGEDFLITCPVSCYSEVEVFLDKHYRAVSGYEKVQKAIEKTLLELNSPKRSFYFTVNSELPRGKGMASSSADISAACMAVARALQAELSVKQIEKIALSIEPTDGIFYQGIVAFGHITGQINEYLGTAVPMKIAVFDTGGQVDTLRFNRRDDLRKLNLQKQDKVMQAYELVKQGLKKGDSALVGQGATISALANQTILPKQHLESILSVAHKHNALGVNVAHSGTVVGVLYDPCEIKHLANCQQAICDISNHISYLGVVDLVNGGII